MTPATVYSPSSSHLPPRPLDAIHVPIKPGTSNQHRILQKHQLKHERSANSVAGGKPAAATLGPPYLGRNHHHRRIWPGDRPQIRNRGEHHEASIHFQGLRPQVDGAEEVRHQD